MEISVWDTYVKREDGLTMHFDILVPSDLNDHRIIFDFGKDYLSTKSFKTAGITANRCRFCHIEQATPEMLSSIEDRGYAIIEMENCHSFN